MSRAPIRPGRLLRPVALPEGSPATIVIPSKYPDIFEDCRVSLDRFSSQSEKILVRDGQDIVDPKGWMTIQGPSGPFVYARNVNLGIMACSGDVLLMNDDVRFIHPRTLESLQGVLALNPSIGILSSLVDGAACNVNCPSHLMVKTADMFVAFVCVLIRRAVFEKVGLLDETFVGYGSEDIDLCRRAAQAGYRSATTSRATVLHGHQGTNCSTSHDRERKKNPNAFSFRPELSDKRYREKWEGAVSERPKTQPSSPPETTNVTNSNPVCPSGDDV